MGCDCVYGRFLQIQSSGPGRQALWLCTTTQGLAADPCPLLTWPEISTYITHLFVSHGFLVFSRKDREREVGSWAISLAIPSWPLFSDLMLCQTRKGSLSNHCKQAKQNRTHKYLGVQINKWGPRENKNWIVKAEVWFRLLLTESLWDNTAQAGLWICFAQKVSRSLFFFKKFVGPVN